MNGDIHALSGAYAVDALDDVERAEFEQHLAECPPCREEVESLHEAAALLAETTITAPSAELRDRVLAEISNVRPLPPTTPTGEESGRDTVTALEPRRRRGVVTLLAAAAAAVAIGTGGIVWQQANDEGPGNRVERVIEARDVETFTVPVGDGGSATVYRSRERNEAAIVTRGMPSAPSGHEYVLWLQHGSTMTPAGVMPEGSDNRVLFSGDAASAVGAAVSVEDAGSDPTVPSDDVVATFSFNA